MSKSKKAKSHRIKVEKENSFIDKIPVKYRDLIAILLIAVPLLIYYLPYEANNVKPLGSDYLASIAQTHLWKTFEDNTGIQVLWNPNIFLGEPIYPHITPRILMLDTLFIYLGKLFYWVFWYMFFGGIGIYFLLRYWKVPWHLALVVAIVFVLLPDWQALVGAGHNSKLRAIMILPWFVLSFAYFFDKRTWSSAGLFAFAFSMLNRTHHFQIVFYGILLVFFLYVYPLVKLAIDKKYKEFAHTLVMFSVALVLTFMTAAQPLFTTNEYAKYSTRGGKPLKLGTEAKSAEKSGGVSFEYATRWSFAPSEILDFFIPHFSGGLQGEKYDGDKFPSLRGRQVPGYWGEKPFNGNYATVGAILFIFALIGFWYNYKNPIVTALGVFVVFSLLLSFGRHFPALYKLFYYYFPYFSKFRAPSMFVNITFIAVLLLAGFGLRSFFEIDLQKEIKTIGGIIGVFIAITLYVYFSSSSFAYATAVEQMRYDAQTLNVIKEIRQEFLVRDTLRLLWILIFFGITVVLFAIRKIKADVAWLLISIIAIFEISGISYRAYSQIKTDNPDLLEKTEFRQTPITKVLTADNKLSRAIVLGNDFTSNHYAYFYPLITGYSAIKLQAIQDLFDHVIFKGKSQSAVNWKVVSMLSGKYVISSFPIVEPTLKKLAEDKSRGEILYLNENAKPKAYFVKQLFVKETPEQVALAMSIPDFSTEKAFVINKLPKNNYSFSGAGSIKILKYEPNTIELTTESNEEQFLVLAEMYYPVGWNATIDGKETELYRTNHVMRGLFVPKGKHKIVLEFAPSSFYNSVTAVWAGNIIMLLLIFGFGYFDFYKKEKIHLFKKK